MKKLIILAAFVFSTAICSNIYAQETTPPGAGDSDLRDTTVKQRSVDLERVDRDAKKSDSAAENTQAKTDVEAEDKLATKYPTIKADYEQIQLSQGNIIKGYQGGDTVDYTQIGKSAMEINKSAMRLHSNLFPAPVDEKSEAKKDEKEMKETKSLRDLIVDLDNSIGGFVTSPMFQNLRNVDAEVSAKAQADLDKIIELSAMLNSEAQKMANSKK